MTCGVPAKSTSDSWQWGGEMNTHPTPTEILNSIYARIAQEEAKHGYDPTSPDHVPVWMTRIIQEGVTNACREHYGEDENKELAEAA